MAPLEALYGRRCRTLLCWYEYGDSVVLGPKIVQQTTDKVKFIRDKMKASQSRKKIYHDKRIKDLEFRQGDHVFLRVNLVTSIVRLVKSKKLTPKFIGSYQISQRIGNMVYKVALPNDILNLHDVFHVSQIQKYNPDRSHTIQMDDVQVRDNLTVEALSMRIDDRELKKLRGRRFI
ncbi:uncharacterized protein LOC127131172 [Lathyrus oleraceus]|uniref:uncharacterized protein LOC127131172 n=1 Tax=Pisum sativum TaxID=3888 RepID=UPI0021D16424|nr:uncharacterized protein LOC127131172 [Pisum sativum]